MIRDWWLGHGSGTAASCGGGEGAPQCIEGEAGEKYRTSGTCLSSSFVRDLATMRMQFV